MMRQYKAVKAGLPQNTLLFFRLGDFYEMFYEDADMAADILSITKTQRQGYPMAGVPFHAANSYINKALAAGKKVAICEQMEPAKAGQLVQRKLTRILTPGTILEDHQVEAESNRYLLSFCFVRQTLHAAWLDLTTGDFQIASEANASNLLPVFTSINPREIVLPEMGRSRWEEAEFFARYKEAFQQFYADRVVSPFADYTFDAINGAKRVADTLGVMSLEGFGIATGHLALGPASALVAYATETLCSPPQNLSQIREYRTNNTLLLDPATQGSLEIFRSTSNNRKGSLLKAMDATQTAMGARLLETFLMAPTLDLATLRNRQACVGECIQVPGIVTELQDHLRKIRDLSRIISRLQNNIRRPRELGAIRETLQVLPLVQRSLAGFRGEAMQSLTERIEAFPELSELLQKSLQDELPAQLLEGGTIRDGYHEQLDAYRSLARNSKDWLTAFEQGEQRRTGIKNLRVKYNNAFGYFIEVTKANLHLVPEDYIRKQTMTNAERYYTQDLKQKEREILSADDQAIALELEIFRTLVAKVLTSAKVLQETAQALAELDVFLGWAQLAREWEYCQPELDEGDALTIDQGRHPVVEQMLREERQGLAGSRAFVPNDTLLSADREQIALITGPNMAGKSTYIRQVALIVLMAQVGSWVPAKQCKVGLVDRIFSRVGASDELSRGHSTFMVEMNETANIINNATVKSLIVLDEIGRGTSTYDGLSIAWSVIEHLHGSEDRGPRTLFATHYHELTQLEKMLARVKNYCVAVKEWNDEIIFVRRVVPGAADRSYGIHVARLAGLPQTVICRAQEILDHLESKDASLKKHSSRQRSGRTKVTTEPDGPFQMSLF